MDLQKTGNLIAAARKAAGMTQEQLAKRLHISHTTVSKWERGLGFPDVSLLEPLSEALGLSLTELFRGERTEPVPETEESVLQAMQTVLAAREAQRREERRKYLSAVVILLAAVFFLAIIGYVDGRRTPKYGGDPTTIRGLWQHVPERSDEERYLVTLSADLLPGDGYQLYIDDRLVDEGAWTQTGDLVFRLDGELLDFTAELVRETNYTYFLLELPGLENTLSMRKRGDVNIGGTQDGFTDQAEYRKLLMAE